MTKVNEKQMTIGFIVVCVLAFVLLAWFSYSKWEEIKLLRVTNQQKDDEIKKEENKLKEIDKFNSEILQLGREYHQFADVLPDNKKLEEFFSAVREVSDELLIPPFGFKPKINTAVKGGPARGRGAAKGGGGDLMQVEVPVSFDATYEQVGQFLNKIEGYQRLISIKDLGITSKNAMPNLSLKEPIDVKNEENLLSVKLKLLTYVYNADPNVKAGANTTSLGGASPTTTPIKKVTEWTPDASRDPFVYYHVLQFKEKEPDKANAEDSSETASEDTEDTICRFYDLDSRCVSPKNKISDYCTKHYQLADEISRQENTLRKAKELIGKIEDAFRKNNQQLLAKYYGEMDEILRYSFKVEWIKIEIEDIRQRYSKIKEENKRINRELILKKALGLKAVMLNYFLEGKYIECISEYSTLTTLLTSDNSGNSSDPEFQTILSEARNLKEKAKIHVEFADLPLEIVGIIWIQKHPEESVAIIDGGTRSVDDFVNHGARIVEIKKGEVVFSYKGENISRKLKVSEY